MKLKRFCAIFLILAFVFSLCGCSFRDATDDSLLKPPRPVGEMYDIQQALENAVTEKYTLKFPTSGDYRSAIFQRDINGDGVLEAVAFYSTVADNAVTMHINFIINVGEEWHSVADFRCVATGVELVDFRDMNADGIEEILVGWSVYGTVDKALGVYSFADSKFTQRAMENYTHYLCEDIDKDGNMELFVSHLDSKNESARAKLIRLTDLGLLELGNCVLDNTATSYYKPIVGKLNNGNTAIYFDAVKGSGLITEVLQIKDSVMTNALTPIDAAPISTYRSSNVEIRDLNGDGVYGIPMPSLLTQTPGAESENIYITDWYTVGYDKLDYSLSALMNYVDGYYIAVPEKWKNKITVTRDTPNRIRTVMAIDEKTGNSSDVLIKVQTVLIDQKMEEGTVKLENATEIARKGDYCYMVFVGESKSKAAVTLDEFKNLFKILD